MLHNVTYFYAAYCLFGGLLFVYLATLHRRLRRAEQTLSRLEQSQDNRLSSDS